MALAKSSIVFAGLAVSGAILGTPAQAGPMVTYTWTTTSEGFGAHVSKDYIYAAMGFSVFVELLNLRTTRRKRDQASRKLSRVASL